MTTSITSTAHGSSSRSDARQLAARRAATSLRAALDGSPSLASASLAIPDVTAPSLDGLHEIVRAARDAVVASITPHDLLVRLDEKRRAYAREELRADGDRVQRGDDVLVSVIAFHSGRVVPFGVVTRTWIAPSDRSDVPCIVDAVVDADMRVGDSKALAVAFPLDYPVPSLRGQRGAFSVSVHGARALRLPDEDDAAFLAAHGVESLEALFGQLARDVRDDRLVAQELDVRDAVLDELAARVHVELPAALIDEEVRRRWHRSEGARFASEGFSVEEQERALRAWRIDAAVRGDVERRLRIALALRAIAKAEGVIVDDDALAAFLRTFALSLADTSHHAPSQRELRDAVAASPSLRASLLANVAHLVLVEHVMRTL